MSMDGALPDIDKGNPFRKGDPASDERWLVVGFSASQASMISPNNFNPELLWAIPWAHVWPGMPKVLAPASAYGAAETFGTTLQNAMNETMEAQGARPRLGDFVMVGVVQSTHVPGEGKAKGRNFCAHIPAGEGEAEARALARELFAKTMRDAFPLATEPFENVELANFEQAARLAVERASALLCALEIGRDAARAPSRDRGARI